MNPNPYPNLQTPPNTYPGLPPTGQMQYNQMPPSNPYPYPQQAQYNYPAARSFDSLGRYAKDTWCPNCNQSVLTKTHHNPGKLYVNDQRLSLPLLFAFQ